MMRPAPSACLPRRQSLVRRLFLPPTRTRATLALFLTFFSYGILYSAPYPAGELITVATWVWVFPSAIGCLSVACMPLVMNAAYGYFVFNLFCIAANMAVAYAALSRSSLTPDLVAGAYKTVRVCMLVTLALCFLQVITEPSIWMNAVPGIALPGGRGAGLRSEPSLLAGPLMVFLCLLALRMQAARALGGPPSVGCKIYRGGVVAMLLLVVMTLSLSVLVVVGAFTPMLFLRHRRMGLQLMGLATGIGIAAAAFADRVRDALNAGGSFQDMITISVASWRNIPDILVILNYSSYLWPGNPADVRAKLTGFAVVMNPGLSWLQFTYSTFSACVTTVGLVATAILFLAGLRLGLRHLPRSAGTRATWLLLYGVNWFLAPKYDVCGWIVLGLLPLAGRLAADTQPCLSNEPLQPGSRGNLEGCVSLNLNSNPDGGLPC